MPYSLNGINKKYGNLEVLHDISMAVGEGKVAGIVGPSGCGKTTLLNIISGMAEPDAGSVDGFSGKTFSYVFQEPRLIRWKNVYDNIAWILKDTVRDTDARNVIVARYLNIAGLSEYKDYYPGSLSGGMKQRTAIARAFAYPSDILLMDEPFKSIDFDRKLKMMDSVHRLWEVDRRTVFFVTHDIQEVVLLGDSIYIMSDKPSAISRIIDNKLEYSKRSFAHPYTARLQQEIYKAMSV